MKKIEEEQKSCSNTHTHRKAIGGGEQSTVYMQQDKAQAGLEQTNIKNQSSGIIVDDSCCDLSIVCINNNNETLNRFLLPSIKKQVGVKYEIRIIDNCGNQYTGARKAFNEAAEVLKGKYIVFVHNDFCFNEPDAFQRVLRYCDTLDPFGVIGVAGCGNEKKKLIQTRIKHGKDKKSVGKRIEEPVSVMTVDECCFIVSRDRFMKTPFTDKDGWHLYAVEYCLQMLDMGLRNFVIPIDAWHYSDGVSLNAAYCKEVKGLLERYSQKYPYINTTVKQWKTDFFTREFYLRYYAFKQKVKAKVVKK